MDEQILYYDVVTQIYARQQKLDIVMTCNSIVIKNDGTTLVLIDDDILQPGESKAYGGNRGEIFRGRHDVNFQVQTVPPATITNRCVVTQKYYVSAGAGQKKMLSEL